MPENRSVAFHFNSPAPLSSGRDDHQQVSEHEKENCQEVSDRDCGNTPNTSELADCKYDSRTDSSRIQHGFGKSSFSAVGPLSRNKNYSGPVASGSVSHRSDSGTTNTRSFAFPILESEWNSSPVRMAKSDTRRLRKHRGWREGLLCCRF